MLALGGGVVGDLVGFTAATYMRGVPVVQAEGLGCFGLVLFLGVCVCVCVFVGRMFSSPRTGGWGAGAHLHHGHDRQQRGGQDGAERARRQEPHRSLPPAQGAWKSHRPLVALWGSGMKGGLGVSLCFGWVPRELHPVCWGLRFLRLSVDISRVTSQDAVRAFETASSR